MLVFVVKVLVIRVVNDYQRETRRDESEKQVTASNIIFPAGEGGTRISRLKTVSTRDYDFCN